MEKYKFVFVNTVDFPEPEVAEGEGETFFDALVDGYLNTVCDSKEEKEQWKSGWPDWLLEDKDVSDFCNYNDMTYITI